MWKAECQKMVSVIGSGKFITTPLIGDDGQPTDRSLVGISTSDKKVLQWMQILHQIGMYMLLLLDTLFSFCLLLVSFHKVCLLGSPKRKASAIIL